MAQFPGVLFLCNSLGIGGAETHVVTLLNLLDTHRFRLSLAYLKRDERLLPKLQRERLQSVQCLDVKSKIDRQAVSRLAEQIDKDEIDVLVCTNNYSMLYGFLARRVAKRPVRIVEVFHTTQLRTTKEKLQSLLYRQLIARCDLLIYVCNNQRDYWTQHRLRARAQVVIHNGIDTDYFTDRFSPAVKAEIRARHGFAVNDYVVGICASFRPEKAHRDLVAALHHLRAGSRVAPKLLLIGDGAERANLEKQIKDLGLTEAVAITGFQSDVRPFIAACDVMVLASHAIETFSISALESMALGKPLILTRIGGADEQVEDGVNGYLFEPGDLSALEQCLQLLADAELRKKMGTEAVRIVNERYQSETMVRAFETEFEKLLGITGA